MAYSNIQFIVATNASFALPSNWNNTDNMIQCIGRGGNSSARQSSTTAGSGGAGGAYAVKTNVNLGAGPVGVQVGVTGSAVVTFIKDTGGTIQVQADYGRNGVPGNGGMGPPGLASNCIPTAGAFNGGWGAYAGQNTGNGDGGAGGGAGGPNGIGQTTGMNAQQFPGYSADGGMVAGPTVQGTSGNSGTEFDATHGCGSGGAGGSGGGARNGGNGGNYGGGGAAANNSTSAIAGIGAGGLIVLQWNVVTAPPVNSRTGDFMQFIM